MELPPGLDFLVEKSDWSQHRFADSPAPVLEKGEVLFRIDRFALTANNISYALSGEQLGYWKFFPAPPDWGRIPAMGYGDVIASRHSDIAEGTRCFGFFPMSRYLAIAPSKVNASRIVDGASHRQDLAPAYNQYNPAPGDPQYHPEHEDALMLMRGLFMTSFLAEDFLEDRGFAPEQVVISSASSKTSIALAHVVKQRGRAITVGLTSARNLEFVRQLGCYDQALIYDAVGDLESATRSVFVDMAGNAEVRQAVHERLRDQLAHSCLIGATHWDQTAPTRREMPGPTPEFFFAPSQVQKRSQEWGAQELQKRLTEAWRSFREFSETWLEVRRGVGREALVAAYEDTLQGRTPAQQGHVLSLWD